MVETWNLAKIKSQQRITNPPRHKIKSHPPKSNHKTTKTSQNHKIKTTHIWWTVKNSTHEPPIDEEWWIRPITESHRTHDPPNPQQGKGDPLATTPIETHLLATIANPSPKSKPREWKMRRWGREIKTTYNYSKTEKWEKIIERLRGREKKREEKKKVIGLRHWGREKESRKRDVGKKIIF